MFKNTNKFDKIKIYTKKGGMKMSTEIILTNGEKIQLTSSSTVELYDPKVHRIDDKNLNHLLRMVNVVYIISHGKRTYFLPEHIISYFYTDEPTSVTVIPEHEDK